MLLLAIMNISLPLMDADRVVLLEVKVTILPHSAECVQ